MCHVHGWVEQLPIIETSPKQPISPYGKSKLMVETILEDIDRSSCLRSVSLRYLNACGG